jgi:ABC-type antimicrobial peptide transport system permease subunit
VKVPFSYIIRSLWTRKLTTILTLSGISLVTFVFAAVLMLAYGIEQTLIETGSENNLIILRKGSDAELMSQIDRNTTNIIKTQPEVMISADGKPFASTELHIIISLTKKQTETMANISVRGTTAEGMLLRPQVKLVEGRMFRFGTSEIIIGSNVAKRFEGCEIGSQLKFGGGFWTIVGIINSGGTGFDSEVWADVEQLAPAFGRPVFSSMIVRLKSDADFRALKTKIESDRRTNFLEVIRERDYYKRQSEFMAAFIRILGTTVTIIFSFGAVIGAMITMYAAVANRTVEIGTMRALGFQRRSILTAFLLESMFIALVGAAVGIAASSLLQFFMISTINFGSFSELEFGFKISPGVIFSTFIFALFMGITGGFLPAARAARLNIVNALRAT